MEDINLPECPMKSTMKRVEKEIGTHYLVFKVDWLSDPLTGRKIKMARVKCSGCGGEFWCELAQDEMGCRYHKKAFIDRAGNVISSGCTIICPECGRKVEVFHTSDFGGYSIKKCNVCFPLEVHNIGGNLCTVQWCVTRTISKDADAGYEINKYKALVFGKRGATRYSGYKGNWYGNYTWYEDWKRMARAIYEGVGCNGFVVPIRQSVILGTPFAHSKLDKYIRLAKGKAQPEIYLRLYQKYPAMENILLQCGVDFVTDIIKKTKAYYYGNQCQISNVKLRSKVITAHECLGIEKQELKFAMEHGWDFKDVENWKVFKSEMTIEQFHDLRCHNLIFDAKRIIERGLLVIKTLKYIEKQRKRYSEIDASLFIDYLDMAEKRAEEFELFPANLRKAHDDEVMLVLGEPATDPVLSEGFAKRAKALKKFKFEYKDLFIRPAECEKELIIEGKLLHHCVSTYAKSHAGGRTSIFFIRRKSEPERPFYTLELDVEAKVVRQNRGYKNCDRTEEVEEFEEQFIKHIKEMDNVGKPSKRSAVNRNDHVRDKNHMRPGADNGAGIFGGNRAAAC